jgi:hypothetical protein
VATDDGAYPRVASSSTARLIPVAQLVALPRSAAPLDELRGRWAKLPPVDPAALRRDIDDVIEPGPARTTR